MRRFKGDQIKVLEEKLCVGADTTKVKLRKSSCRFSPHLKLPCQVSVYTLQLLPPFLTARGMSQLFSTSHSEAPASICSSCQIIQMDAMGQTVFNQLVNPNNLIYRERVDHPTCCFQTQHSDYFMLFGFVISKMAKQQAAFIDMC